MANIPISQLPAITASTSTTLLPVVEGGITSRITRDEFIPRAYAQYINTVDQTLSANTPTTVNIGVVNVENDITLSANTVTFTKGGIFLISASYQFSQGAGAADIAYWFKKNNGEIANSATHAFLHTGNSRYTSMITLIESFNAGDTLQLRIQSTSSNTKIDNIDASGSIPDAPGVILTINQLY